MVATLDSILSDMSLSDVVQALLILKPGKQSFRADDFKRRLEGAAIKYASLGRVLDYHTTGDGTSPSEKISGFDSALDRADTVSLIWGDPHFYHLSYYHIRDSNKPIITQFLQEDYGQNVLEELRPLAGAVWS